MAQRSSGYAKIRPMVESNSGDGAKPGSSKLIIQGMRGPYTQTNLMVSVLVAFVVFIFFRYSYGVMPEISFIIAGLFFVFALFVMMSVVFLETFEKLVVQRYGKYNRTAGPGWTFIMPFIETYNIVDTRVKTIDLLGYEAITKDNIRLYLDVVVYARIVDLYKAVLEVKDVNTAILTFLKSITRETVGNLTAEEVISNIAKVNELLIGERDRLKKEWGVDLISVEIQEITLPSQVQESMHNLRSAEYQRQVVEQQAYAREALISAIQRAASKLDNPSLAYMYLEALKKVADGQATKLIFPMELTRLAESVTKHFGGDKDKFLQDIMKAYNETVAKDIPRK
jgi:regulator of protease activity HflC (stomatin/prohibitin superfamily)